MDMKQTAVEWLEEQLTEYFYMRVIESEKKDIRAIEVDTLRIKTMFEKANAMEKEQIEDAFNFGVYDGGGIIKKYKMSGEKYYNETFKSE
jgi:hypothetical protein